MNDKLDTKWKHFSVDLHFSSYSELVTPEAVFDILTECNSEDEWDYDIIDMDVSVWYPFENMNWEDLRESLKTTAEHAQQYSEIS